MEKDGNLKGAWELLHEEYKAHTDHEYFDEETSGILHDYLEALFARHPGLVAERINLLLDEMSIGGYWGSYDDQLMQRGVELSQNANRPDLELMMLEKHRSCRQALSKGYDFDSDSLDERIAELKQQIESEESPPE
jgi:hypothetical protein